MTSDFSAFGVYQPLDQLCAKKAAFVVSSVLDCAQGCIYFGGIPCVFMHFSLTRLKTKTIGKEGTGGSLSVILLG